MIERAYPGVYLAEVQFGAKPIDGVPTTQPAHTPEWTNFNSSDPGVTLVELLSFLSESLLYRTDLVPHRSDSQAIGSGLSATTSKYIGETEKNLSTAFSDAKPSGTLLHYDEAHALFRKPD
jgi:hypothetical protein